MNQVQKELLIEFIALNNTAKKKGNKKSELVLLFEKLNSQLDVTK